MNRTGFILFLFCFVLLSCQQQAKNTPPSTKPLGEIEAAINTLLRQGDFHGAVMVGHQDSVLFQRVQGLANRNWNQPITIDTRFDIASLNKSFIAALTLKAAEQGRFQLESKLVDLLLPFPYNGHFDSGITVHQLLCHTSGLPDYNAVDSSLSANHFVAFKRMHFTNAAYVDFISQLPAHGKPNEGFYYSNFAYHLLAIILETTYNKPFSNLLKEQICDPLQLHHTFSSTDNQALHERLAVGYQYGKSTEQWVQNNFIDLTLGRRIFASVGDLYRWGKALNDSSWIAGSSLRLLQQNHLENSTKNVSYGYGWAVHPANSEFRFGNLNIDASYVLHGGSTEGFKSILVNIDQGTYIIAILSNSGNRTNELELAQKIAHILVHDEK